MQINYTKYTDKANDFGGGATGGSAPQKKTNSK